MAQFLKRETAHGRSGHSHLTSSPFRGTIRATVGAIILVAMFLHGVGEAQAQTTAVCNNTPAAGERIKCEEYGDSTNNIDIDTSNITISTTADVEGGIEAIHFGNGDVEVNMLGGVSITTGGGDARRGRGEPRR